MMASNMAMAPSTDGVSGLATPSSKEPPLGVCELIIVITIAIHIQHVIWAVVQE
jgi:hypothetical protein